MRKVLSILLLLISLSLQAQKDLGSLAEQLFRNCRNDRQKVTAIVDWITGHVSYTTFNTSSRRRPPVINETDEEGPLPSLDERVAELVLKRRTAFCDGYARLFSALCQAGGIRSEIICGYANGGFGRPGRFGVNHYWNAVFLEGQWQLLDLTWASGYINLRDGEFVRQYNGRYIFTSPDIFIRDHYPDDPRWTLLPDPKVPDEFRQSPFRQRSFAKYGFTSFSPGKGIIEAALGDTIVLQLETRVADRGAISPSTLVDSAFFTHSPSWVFLKPEPADALRFRYTYAVSNPGVEWLYLLYNDDVVMRYKINVTQRTFR